MTEKFICKACGEAAEPVAAWVAGQGPYHPDCLPRKEDRAKFESEEEKEEKRKIIL